MTIDECDIKIPSLKYNTLTQRLITKYYANVLKNTEKFIFVATTGRSGTSTLTNIFNACESVSSHHEPYPIMYAQNKSDNKHSSNREQSLFKTIKLPNILRTAKDYRFYFEANHMFIKHFIKYAVETFGNKIIVVHLKREPLKVAASITSIGNPPGTAEGNKWWLSYKSKNNIINVTPFLESFSGIEGDFIKSLWYWYEIEARIQYWKTQFPTIQFLNIETEDLNNLASVQSLLSNVGVTCKKTNLERIIGKRFNLKSREKNLKQLPIKRAEFLQKSLIAEIELAFKVG